ncbi:formimidoylglutamate deiminase [Haematobacter genomosp. 1]|uniref:Formimidoylglutamate deiminase n=1 Tax=Haematobacter genomosp. 1 TaxID=366618 RepID=A0A212A736_9RHOB|nr:formimidoylglutamate deiminase [Haematobacter genomosp. 1]OWJ75189.1 formimidoylglutamate deiminase [Haematobacter genomosp. 1]
MTILWAETALTPEGWRDGVRIEIAEGRILSVTCGTEAEGERHPILLPAPVNLHSHAFQRAMAGLTERRGPDPKDSFWTWRGLMYRFLDHLTPEDVEAIAAFVQVEMLEAGYAAVAEFHYLHNTPNGAPYADPAEMSARIVAAAADTGIGLTLLPVFYQYGGCDRRPLGPGQMRFFNTPDSFAVLHAAAAQAVATLPGDARIGIAPHSLRAADPEGLAAVLPLAPDGPVHIHVAEQVAEVEEVLAHRGARPVRWLLDNAAVDERWCLIHATQMEPAETEAMARSGAVAGLCPITESNLGDGIFDGRRFLDAGGAFGVGSDSNVRIALAEELRTLEYSQRLRDRARAVLAEQKRSTGRVLFEGAAKGGAQAAGRAAGGIAPGLWADLVALDGGAVDLDGRRGDVILDSYIFAGDDRMVSDVWSAGRHVVTEGRHVSRDRIAARYRETLARLRARL